MTAAALAGLGFGALHAVAGPDHVLSLAPHTVARPRAAWRIGLWWGAGHALGTLAFAAAALAAASVVHAERFAPLLDRAAGLALVATGLLGLRRAWALRHAGPDDAAHGHRAGFAVGAVHGFTGAAAIVLALPALAGPGALRLGWLAGFAAGSTVAMSLLTAGLAAGSRAFAGPLVRWAAPAASAASIALGLAWTVA